MLCYLMGIEPYCIQCIKDGPFKPKTANATSDKHESQWTEDEKRAVNQDKPFKSIIIPCLLDDIMESVISCETSKATWTDLVHNFEGPSDTKENKITDLKLKYQTFRAKPFESLSQTYTRYKTLLNELANDGVTLSKHEINVNKVQVMGTLDGRLLNNAPGYINPLRHYLEVLQIGIRARLAMSLDNASSAVTYTSVSSDSMDHHGSPTYVPDPIELDEHVPVYVLEPDHPEYHVPSDDDIQVEDQPYADDALPIVESPGLIADSESMEDDSIDYPDEPKDDDEDPEEDHTDYPDDGEDGDDEPSDDDDDDDDTDDEDEEPIEEEEEEHLAPADSSTIPIVDHVPSTGDTEAFETDESAPTPRSPQTRHAAAPIPPISLAYDQTPLGHRAAMIRMRDDILEEDMPPRRRFVLTAPLPGCDVVESYVAASRPPRGQYDFVDTIEAGQGLIRSPGHD
ncbi:hypothetical protein Tco_0368743, partial [Tanacetum coccineum]